MNIDVYVSNISEDVWSFIDTLKGEEKKFEIDENAFLSDRELLTLNPHTHSVIVLPAQLDSNFVEYYKKIFNNTNIEVWVPNKHSGQTCLDLQEDGQLWQKLISLGKDNTLIVKSYSSSQQFFDLVESLRSHGCVVKTPESPKKNAEWTVNYFGSKSGVRKTVTEITKAQFPNQKWIADGEVAKDRADAVTLATDYYLTKGGVVIKTNKAHSGAGVIIITPGKLGSVQAEVQKHFEKLFNQEEYWSTFPIVIEEHLDIDSSVGGGNPNCEYRITEDGRVVILYICGMRVTADGIFKGVEVNNTIFSPEITQRLLLYGSTLGATYAEAGYRGYFDVDCIYTRSGELLITESNVRKTGGTHVYHTAKILLGDDFGETHYLLSNNTHPLPEGRSFTFTQLLERLEPLCFSKEKSEGILLASSNILKQGKISHIIIGKTKESAYKLEQKMEQLLEQ